MCLQELGGEFYCPCAAEDLLLQLFQLLLMCELGANWEPNEWTVPLKPRGSDCKEPYAGCKTHRDTLTNTNSSGLFTSLLFYICKISVSVRSHTEASKNSFSLAPHASLLLHSATEKQNRLCLYCYREGKKTVFESIFLVILMSKIHLNICYSALISQTPRATEKVRWKNFRRQGGMKRGRDRQRMRPHFHCLMTDRLPSGLNHDL